MLVAVYPCWHAFWGVSCCVYGISVYLHSGYYFVCLCTLPNFVVTTRLLGIGLVQPCILSWFCIGKFLKVCIEVCDRVATSFFRIALVSCDPWWHLPLWQSSSGGITWVHSVSVMVLFECCCMFFPHLTSFCWWMQSVIGCCCGMLHLEDNSFHLLSAVALFTILSQMHHLCRGLVPS